MYNKGNRFVITAIQEGKMTKENFFPGNSKVKRFELNYSTSVFLSPDKTEEEGYEPVQYFNIKTMIYSVLLKKPEASPDTLWEAEVEVDTNTGDLLFGSLSVFTRISGENYLCNKQEIAWFSLEDWEQCTREFLEPIVKGGNVVARSNISKSRHAGETDVERHIREVFSDILKSAD